MIIGLGQQWYVGLAVGFLLWWVACQWVWRTHRRRAEANRARAEAVVRARLDTDAVIVDPGQSLFVAVDGGRTCIKSGPLDAGPTTTRRIADFTAAKVIVDEAWGLFLDRERTPVGRVLSTLYFPLQPIVILLSILSIFDGSGSGEDPTIRHKRVIRIRIVATAARGANLDIIVYDEKHSAAYPRASKSREREARELVTAIRRGIANENPAAEASATA